MNTWLTKNLESLSKEVKKYKKGCQEIDYQKGKPSKYCLNCKRYTWHDPDDCFGIEENAHKRHPRWKLCVKWRYGATRVEIATNINNNINRSNIKLPSFSSTLINIALQSNQLYPHNNTIADKWRRKFANRAAIKIPKMVWQLWIQAIVEFTWRQRPLRRNLIGLLLIFK